MSAGLVELLTHCANLGVPLQHLHPVSLSVALDGRGKPCQPSAYYEHIDARIGVGADWL